MNETLVIYHGACRDGFCAAWVVNKFLKKQKEIEASADEATRFDAQYMPAFYGQEPLDCKDIDVIIVDFCYPLDIMKSIYEKCNSLIWLDHHKTAESVAEYFMNETLKDRDSKLKMKFRNDNSGAGLAWDYFFPNEPRPWLVDYVEDRDLWLHKLDESHKVNALIACLEFNFKVWDEYENFPLSAAVQGGNTALMKTEQYVKEVCKNVYFADWPARYTGNNSAPMLANHRIPVVNIPQVDCSEVCENLLKLYLESLFTLYWFKRADGMYQYGLRSRNELDVSAIAKLFGGGGHHNAAGFQLPYLLEELK